MSLFQCENCGCVENTAASNQGFHPEYVAKFYDWSEIPDLRGKKICSACGPSKYQSGKPTGFGVWHGLFNRIYLPKDKFRTNDIGNLEHVDTGEDFKNYIIHQ